MRIAIRLSESHRAEVDRAVQAVTRARQTGLEAADEAASKAITDLAARVRVSRVQSVFVTTKGTTCTGP